MSLNDCAHGGGLKGDLHLVDLLRLVWFALKKKTPRIYDETRSLCQWLDDCW